MIELALNNRILTIIGESAFYINYGRYPNFFNILRKFPQIDAALKEISNLKRVYKEFLKNIKYQQKKGEPNVNKKKEKTSIKKKYIYLLKILRSHD